MKREMHRLQQAWRRSPRTTL